MGDYELFSWHLRYEPETGLLFWIKPATGRRLDWPAGYVCTDRYLRVQLKGRLYLGHRVAWLLTNQEWPKDQIDHIDHDRSNNQISNLREVDNATNTKNKSMQSNNTSGIAGVCLDHGKWQARIIVGRKAVYLGRFDDIRDAAAARKIAEIKYGFHPNHGKAS